MTKYEESLNVMTELFAKDFTFSLATVKDNIPSIRVIDTFYDDGVFWIVTYEKSQKVEEIKANPDVALCHDLYRFSGKAYYAGHPLDEKNKEIREKLIVAFEPWYFAHNNEDDQYMCYVRVELEKGFFFKDGTGYKTNFIEKDVETFPFESFIDESAEKL